MRSGSLDKQQQLAALKNGKGIQYLLDKACEILGNPLLIHGMDYTLISFAEPVPCDDVIWREFMERGKLSDETIEFFKNECFIDIVANSANYGGVTYLISDKLKYDRIFGQLYNKEHLPVVDLCMVASELPFEENSLQLVKMLCDIMTAELAENDYYQIYGQCYQEAVIKNLIEGAVEDKGIYTGHVANLDKGLKTYIYAAVADISHSDHACAGLAHFRDLLKPLYPDFKYAIHENYVVILIHSDDALLSVKIDLCEMNTLLERENAYVGISSAFQNLFELRRYYAEAIEALQNGMLLSEGAGRIFLQRNVRRLPRICG